MARHARNLGESGYLHLIVRGVGRQAIFVDWEDYRRFLSALERFSTDTGVKVIAWCLMENHAHLLVRDGDGQTSRFMKKLEVSYCRYFNKKYERLGHLFQDRYLSEVIEDDAYLLRVFRHILNNPKWAGICEAKDYRWSSYSLYDRPAHFMDLTLVRELIGSRADYERDIRRADEDTCLEYDGIRRDDAWAGKAIAECLRGKRVKTLWELDPDERSAALRRLKARGLTVRQIERLTGINRGVVQRA